MTIIEKVINTANEASSDTQYRRYDMSFETVMELSNMIMGKDRNSVIDTIILIYRYGYIRGKRAEKKNK